MLEINIFSFQQCFNCFNDNSHNLTTLIFHVCKNFGFGQIKKYAFCLEYTIKTDTLTSNQIYRELQVQIELRHTV